MAAWDSTNSNPLADIKAAIEQVRNAPFIPEVHVVSRELYEHYKAMFERRRDAATR